LDDARASLQVARSAVLNDQLPAADVAVAAARRDTEAARRLTSDPLWRVAGTVPFLGRSFAVARAVARTADDVATQVVPPALRAARLLEPSRLRGATGAVDLQLVRRATPELATAAVAARALDARLARERKGGIAPVARARDDLGGQLTELAGALTSAERAARLAAPLLGEDRPRRYFVLIQQVSESRGTGGLPGGFVVMQARGGRLTVTAQGSNADLPGAEIPPPGDLDRGFAEHYGNLGSFALWVNVNLSPDLPSVAKIIVARWQQATGERLDGVVAVDAQGLASVLKGADPVPVPGGKVLTADNIVDYLAIGQYRDFAAPVGAEGLDRSADRKGVLRAISQAATARLIGGGGDTRGLLEGLTQALRSGHLRMTSADPALASGLTDAGVTGALPAGPAPVAYPVAFSSSGGKLDHFLDRRISYDAGPCGGTRRDSRIAVSLKNGAPARGLPPYLTILFENGKPTQSTTNRITLMVYGTRGAKLRRATLDGVPLQATGIGTVPIIETFEENGLPVFHVLLDLPRERRRMLVLELDEPASPGVARVPEQPLARPLARTVRVPTC